MWRLVLGIALGLSCVQENPCEEFVEVCYQAYLQEDAETVRYCAILLSANRDRDTCRLLLSAMQNAKGATDGLGTR
jgi:hypothetical protein